MSMQKTRDEMASDIETLACELRKHGKTPGVLVVSKTLRDVMIGYDFASPKDFKETGVGSFSIHYKRIRKIQ